MSLFARHRALVINLLFSLYLALIAPRTFASLDAVVRHDRISFTIGLLILGGLIAETAAFHIKIMAIYNRYPDRRSTLAHPVLFYLTWFNHVFIGTCLVMLALQAIGVKIDGTSAAGPVILVGWILKEFYIFGFLLVCRGRRPIAASLEWVSDLLLMVFACLVYTFFVLTITGPAPFEATNLFHAAGIRAAYAVIFTFFYAAAQAPQFFEICLEPDVRNFRRWLWSLAGIIILAALTG